MSKKIPVSKSFKPMLSGLEEVDFSSLGDLPPGDKPAEPEEEVRGTASHGPIKPGRITLRREKSGRGGKVVVIADGFSPEWTDTAISALAKTARQSCGCGGTSGSRTIELQGDQVAKIRHFFESMGFHVGGVK